MQPLNINDIVAIVTGPKGDTGPINQSDIDALLGGVASDGNTLAKLRALIASRATIDGANLTNVTVPTQSAGNNSTKAASTAFVHQEVENRATTLQPKDALLTALAALVTTADGLPYFTGVDTVSQTPLTAFARSLLDDTDAATMRATLAVLALAGGTLTGPLTLAADPSSALQAATKQYVDSVAQGLDAKQSVRFRATTNINLASGLAAGTTHDGVTAVAGDRVLVPAQSAGAQNGIYIVPASGAAARAADMDSWAEVPGAFVFVEEGTLYADTGWVCTANIGGTLGTTAIGWTQFSGAGTYTAGAGLSLTGTQFAISDAELLALAGLTSAANKVPKFTGAGTAALLDSGSFGEALLSTATAAAAKTALAIVVADITDASANGRSLVSAANYAAMKTLLAIAGADITDASANGRSIISAANYAAMKTLLAVVTADIGDASASGRSLITAADYATMRTLLGLVIGTNVQAYSANLTGFAGKTAPTGAVVGTSDAQTLTTKAIDASANTVSNLLLSMFAANVVDTDGTLAANSDTRVATQKAVVTYVAGRIAALDVMVFKGTLDCSANPNYPAADAGATYRVTVAGKIGGPSGQNVEAGDILLCTVDATVSGNHATVGANWDIIQVNIDGAVVGPVSSTSGNIATFSGTSGKVVQDSGKALPTGALLGLTDAQSPTNKTFDNTNTVTLKDTLFTLQDDGDATKQARFELSGIATGTMRSFTLPNANTSLVGTDTTQTLSNKTLDTPVFTTSISGPLHVGAVHAGGTATTSVLRLRSTTAAGATGADIIVEAGNNGATEIARFFNGGGVSIGTSTNAGDVLNLQGAANTGVGLYNSSAQQQVGFRWNATAGGYFFLVDPALTTKIQLLAAGDSFIAGGGLTIGSNAAAGAGNIVATASVKPGSFTVATLPVGATGKMVWASDCRTFNGAGVQEGSGAGTGALVVYNGSAWKIAGTNVTAVA